MSANGSAYVIVQVNLSKRTRLRRSIYVCECVWYFKTNSISSVNFRLIHLIYRTIYARCSCTDHRPITRCTTHSLGIKVHFMRFSNITFTLTNTKRKWLLCVFLFMAIFMDNIFIYNAHDGRCAPARTEKLFRKRNLRPSYR